jgi:hypothetical protein
MRVLRGPPVDIAPHATIANMKAKPGKPKTVLKRGWRPLKNRSFVTTSFQPLG